MGSGATIALVPKTCLIHPDQHTLACSPAKLVLIKSAGEARSQGCPKYLSPRSWLGDVSIAFTNVNLHRVDIGSKGELGSCRSWARWTGKACNVHLTFLVTHVPRPLSSATGNFKRSQRAWPAGKGKERMMRLLLPYCL